MSANIINVSKSKSLLCTESRGAIANGLIGMLIDELDKILNGNSNLSEFFVCANFMLIKDKRITSNEGIKKRVLLCMDKCEKRNDELYAALSRKNLTSH